MEIKFVKNYKWILHTGKRYPYLLLINSLDEMPNYTGYKMAFEDWDVDKIPKNKKHQTTIYFRIYSHLVSRAFNHQRHYV